MKSQAYIKRFRNISLLGLTLVFSLLATSCGGGEQTTEEKQAHLQELKTQRDKLSDEIRTLERELLTAGVKVDTSDKKLKIVSATVVMPDTFRHYLDLQGKVEADDDVLVMAEMPGTVKRVFVKEGDAVAAGQTVAELDNSVLMKGIAELDSGLAFARTLYNKQKNLWDRKIGTEVQYLSAKQQVESLEQKRATLMAQAAMYKIKSPISGTIDEVFAKAGQTASPGMPAVRVVNLGRLKASAEVAENYVTTVKQGNNVEIEFPALSKSISTRIGFTSKVINPMNRTFNVEVNLAANPDYRPNMLAIFKVVDYENPQALVVPLNVVQNMEDGHFLYVAESSNGVVKAVRRKVKTGSIYNGVVEILEGLKTGDKVITSGYQNVNDGQEIQL
jgi:RND family efflux transporter MFP subunit